MRRYGHAVLGGTFDRLHVGHTALLATALRLGRRVSIGVTTTAFLRRHPKPGKRAIQAYATRRRALDRWLSRHVPRSRYRLRPLNDAFGGSVAPGVDVLVVSAETAGGGARVNAERRRLGRRPVPIVVVPIVLADDLEPVSSRRIRAGVIDRWGRRRSPIRVGLRCEHLADRAPVSAAIRDAFPRVRLHYEGASGRGAGSSATRASRLSAAARAGREIGVGVAGSGRIRVLVESAPGTVLAPRSVSVGSRGALRHAVGRILSPPRPQRL